MPPIDQRTQDLQKPSSSAVLAGHVEPSSDMRMERSRATFDSSQLAAVLNGGEEAVKRRFELATQLAATPWGDKSRRYFLTREEEYVGGLQAALGIWQKMKDDKLDIEDGKLMRSMVDFPGGLELHIGMFIPSLLSSASAEQQAHWLPLAMQLKVIGTYAQTELGHGTFVRGLETTATYDPQSQEFIIHSPTLSATKWWPGGLAKTSTHALVMARLFTGGPGEQGAKRDRGPHAFIVPLRSLEDHLPLPGVTVGDIGPKFGYNGVDNGYLSMDHVRIPRDNMLMRFAKVAPDGQYVPPPPANSKASYATMLFVRADIVRGAGGALAKAVTVATRYCAVRRQTASAPGRPETQVLDFQNCSYTLLPLLATSYALLFMAESMLGMYSSFEADRDKGDFAALPELHALSSGLKAVCTSTTADGIEACRRTCGGHGYSKLSGLPTMFENYVQNVTWEGDNNVLLLQTARYLLKALGAAVQPQQAGRAAPPPPTGSSAYLANVHAEIGARCQASGASCWDRPAVRVAALQHWATRLAVEAAETLRAAVARHGGAGASKKASFEGPAWNDSTVAMIRVSRAHCNMVLHKNFLMRLEQLEASRQLPAAALSVLHSLASLFALSLLEKDMGDLLEDGYFTGAQAGALRSRQRSLLLELRPNAVALVDAFAFTDYDLNSAIGRQDGDVYRALLDMAQSSPLNATPEGPAWHNVLKPAMASMAGRRPDLASHTKAKKPVAKL